ncbi:Diacylglycerol kinase family enzyme [Sanguibacter gelidistatuariae]|uniref:Diacylglycerol kinase family enzyme n=1 Tax=Sanguibacter gelidistatuariae TaxID=1814289 RepID=A0A1G6GY43_9MICO|nr:diacylglycerol kinase family protein [Sanguibacter gelidistatuariae]SDB86957.1 Diacylglycerol kinase family enzyme [Sanguibacter gelidistatuariae]
MELEVWLLVVATVVALVAIGLALVVVGQQRALRTAEDARNAADDAAPTEPAGPVGPLLAFVANPSKNGMGQLRPAVVARCAAENLREPLWFETTVDDPGVGQTREALARGADVVVAVGGDGTVRAVAEAMVGTGRPMGLLPMGTGNLLARNLDISVTDREEAFDVALHGMDRAIDVGWLRVDRPAPTKDGSGKKDDESQAPADTKDHIFLVIAGLGFDAAMVADTDANLKSKVGWVAYFLAGFRHLHGRRLEMVITLDDRPPVTARLRSLMVGNCGRLPGGITLIPDAVIDDGIHDIAAIDTRGGIMGWAQLFGEVMMQGFGVTNDLPNKIGRIDHTRAKKVQLHVSEGEQVQVDGDVLGRAIDVSTWVDPGALIVRAPVPRLSSK